MRHEAAQRGCVVCIVVWCAALCISEYDDARSPCRLIRPCVAEIAMSEIGPKLAVFGLSVNGSMVEATS